MDTFFLGKPLFRGKRVAVLRIGTQMTEMMRIDLFGIVVYRMALRRRRAM